MDRSGGTPDAVAVLRAARRAALAEIGAAILRESTTRVPIDTGELAASGESQVVYDRVYVVYTDPKAVLIHEDLTANFDGGREAKFLENALAQVRSRVVQIAAGHLRRALT